MKGFDGYPHSPGSHQYSQWERPLTHSLTHSVILITSRASSDAKKMLQCKVSEPEQADLGLVMGWRISKTTARITLSKGPSFSNFWQLLAMFENYWQWSGNIWQFWLTFSYIWQRLENFVMTPLRQVIMSPCHLIILAACQLSACQSTCICFSACAYWSSQLVWTNTNWMQKGNNFMSFWNIWKKTIKSQVWMWIEILKQQKSLLPSHNVSNTASVDWVCDTSLMSHCSWCRHLLVSCLEWPCCVSCATPTSTYPCNLFSAHHCFSSNDRDFCAGAVGWYEFSIY